MSFLQMYNGLEEHALHTPSMWLCGYNTAVLRPFYRCTMAWKNMPSIHQACAYVVIIQQFYVLSRGVQCPGRKRPAVHQACAYVIIQQFYVLSTDVQWPGTTGPPYTKHVVMWL